MSFSWSHSKLEAYATCPKRHYHISVKKDFKETYGAEADYGSKAHKFFEDYLLKGTPLPMDLQHHGKMLDKIKAAPGEGYGEQKLAINRDYEATGYFDTDTWARGQVDYLKINGSAAAVFDWKFGKMKEDMQQLQIFALFVAIYRPQVERITSAFYWAKDKKFTKVTYTRDEVPALWNGLLPKINKLEVAYKTLDFPAKPSGLCKKYCPVTSCPHNGGYV